MNEEDASELLQEVEDLKGLVVSLQHRVRRLEALITRVVSAVPLASTQRANASALAPSAERASASSWLATPLAAPAPVVTTVPLEEVGTGGVDWYPYVNYPGGWSRSAR